MKARCSNGHTVPVRDLNLVVMASGDTNRGGGAWKGSQQIWLLCNSCMADLWKEKSA